jgi:hypothetical protein
VILEITRSLGKRLEEEEFLGNPAASVVVASSRVEAEKR